MKPGAFSLGTADEMHGLAPLLFPTMLAACALAACAKEAPSPVPTDVEAVLAGAAPDALHPLTQQEQTYLLAALRHCEWHPHPVATPDAELVYEIREASGRSEYVRANGSPFYIGQLYCQLASTPAFRLWKMAEWAPSGVHDPGSDHHHDEH